MNEVVLTALVSVATALGTWYAARRKNLADTQASELDNVEKAVKFYREQLEDIAIRWSKATADANKIHELYIEAIKDLNALEIRFNKLADENRSLIEELRKYKQLNGKVA